MPVTLRQFAAWATTGACDSHGALAAFPRHSSWGYIAYKVRGRGRLPLWSWELSQTRCQCGLWGPAVVDACQHFSHLFPTVPRKPSAAGDDVPAAAPLAMAEADLHWAALGPVTAGRSDGSSTFWFGTEVAHTPCHLDTYGVNFVVQLFGHKVRWQRFAC